MNLTFSCLSGNKDSLDDNLGALFTFKRVGALEDFLKGDNLLVIVDDLEPVRIWQWDVPQDEVTGWIRLVLEASVVPEQWKVKLWSDIENVSNQSYEGALKEMQAPKHALLVHRLFMHMQEFPNKKASLSGNKAFKQAALRRVAHYAMQGVVLEELYPSAVLLQNETPWKVKDPLFQPLRTKPFQIIHPFEERR